MWALIGVGFVAGLVTAASPCILPVLPVVFAGGTTSGPRRSIGIVAGVVVSFSVAELFGVAILQALHLPADLLYDVGIALLLLLAVGLVIDPIGELIERPFAKLAVAPRVGAGTKSGFVLGLGLGLVFAPCAGLVLTAISTVAARQRFSVGAVELMGAYALGVAVPLLVVALAAQALASRWQVLRSHAPVVRRVSGALIAIMAVVILTNVAAPLQTDVPSYANAIETHFESASVRHQLLGIEGEHANRFVDTQDKDAAASLPDLGPAPNFTGITAWLNTPGDRPLTLAELRGKVVLVDFWTYSCINCRRSLPHVEAWYKAYAKDGLVVVGVHTPEFAFEHVPANVATAAAQLGVRYPIAIDDNYATWTAYNNNSWPAEYLIDQHGDVRHTDIGEGGYATMEADIRALLVAGGATHLPAPTDVPNKTPVDDQTPETYLGYENQEYYADNVAGDPVVQNAMTHYTLPKAVTPSSVAFGGDWDIHFDEAIAGRGATLALQFVADDVYIVLGGKGTVTVSLNGAAPRRIEVTGIPNLYTLTSSSTTQYGLLTLSVSPGVDAYDITFG